jgi:uncharacterized integral membrane protein (TIGR00697 family)
MLEAQPLPYARPGVLTTPQIVYVWLAGFFVSCLVIADIVGIKLFRIPLPFSFPNPFTGGTIDAIEHTCGMLTFPVTFLLTDLINEYYGARGARRVTFMGLFMAGFVFIVINVAQYMPYLDAPFNVRPEAFDAIFGSAKVMYIASLCAYLIGQLSDIAVFGLLKRISHGKLLWLRATGSTLISQFIDSFIVTYLAFHLGRKLFGGGEVVPWPSILPIAITGYLLKFVLAIAITPLIYLGHGIMHRWFGLTPVPAEPRA